MVHALGAAAGLDAALAVPQPAGGERYAFGEQLLDAAAARQPAAWGAVEVGGESPMSGRGDRTAHWLTVNDADYRGTAGRGAPSLLVLDPAARTKDLADRFAAGRLAVAARTAHQLRVTVLGRPQVDLGATVTAADVPDALAGGSGYVRAVRHRFGGDGGFLTDLRVSVEVRP
jgi:hypothetical protein